MKDDIQDNIQIELERKYKEKWSCKDQSDDYLKKIAIDIYNNEIFCDRHISQSNLVASVFMPLIFMAPHSKKSDSTSENRDSIIYDLLEKEIEEKYYKEFIPKIGLIYEYLSERMSQSINGLPIFFSCRFLSQGDTKKMFEFYEKYKELRESIDNF